MGRFIQTAIVSAGLVCAFAFQAKAATVNISQNDADYTLSTIPSSSTYLTCGTNPACTGSVYVVDGSVSGLFRSPFENAATPGTGVGDWASLYYTSIEANGTLTYSFSSPENNLSILWGSPDEYNTLEFFSGPDDTGSLLYTITGNELELTTVGHDLVDVSFIGEDFESIYLTTTANAFEFADLKVAATPLPATLPLLISGMAAFLIYFRFKRNAKEGSTGV